MRSLIKSLKHIKILKLFIISLIINITLFAPYPFLYLSTYGNTFSNSFYTSDFYSNKTAMVIVPHEDDEIPVAGAMIKNLTLNHCNVIVVYTTNGDYDNLGELRLNEAISAAKVLEVPAENVVFLGYGDQWDAKSMHIYNTEEDELIKSYIGNMQTYGLSTHKDFRSSISGEPSVYTRANYKKDMKDVILKYEPDLIFSVDFDSHQDHRATSLIFEEALCEILESNEDYTPYVYKGFSYNTAWKSIADYYNLNLEATLLPNKENLNSSNYELDVPNYAWEQRVRFLIPPDMLSYTLRGNLIYRALSKHSSQEGVNYTENTANSDNIFWERRTDSLTYASITTVSSGESKYINDFKLIDCSDIKAYKAKLDNCVWLPIQNDKEKSVKITFKSPKSISVISLYDNFSLEDNILKGTLKFSDGTQINVGPLNKNGSRTDIEFTQKQNIKYVEFNIDQYEGTSPGLCEMEVYKSNESTEKQFIKLMLANASNTFIYKYVCPTNKEIPLDVYMYPSAAQYKTEYKIQLIDNADGSAQLQNNTLTFKSTLFPKKCKVRVELVDNPQIYDEVEILSYSVCNNVLIEGIQGYERLFDKYLDFIARVSKKFKKALEIL